MESLLVELLQTAIEGALAAALPWLQQVLTQPKPLVVDQPSADISNQVQNAVTQWEQTHP
jgi:hypothetical protein